MPDSSDDSGLSPVSWPSTGTSASDTPAVDPPPRDTRRRGPLIRRGVALVMVALLVPTGWSYVRALTAPGTDPWTARSVEWLRDHGMNGAVNTVEH
jgi:hypothetical protein